MKKKNDPVLPLAMVELQIKLKKKSSSLKRLKRKSKIREDLYLREVQIEAALEKVRSRAMAMQKSEDLAGAVSIVFEELELMKLGILRCGIGIINKENKSVTLWTTTKSDNDSVVQVSGPSRWKSTRYW